MTCHRYDRSTLKKLRRLVSAQHNEIIKLTLQRDFALAHLLDREVRLERITLDRPEIFPGPTADICGDLVLPLPAR